MGAFFIAEYCRDSVVTGNQVDGTNGSRVMSVEKSSQDVTIVGNTFRGGGRGSWINQPRNLIMQGNVFVNNTTKGERDPARGRRSYETGDYERWPEMYFTTHEPGGTYGPVLVTDNIFETGPEARESLHFAAGGHDLTITGNHFHGPVRQVSADPACERVHLADNHGI
jgi:nitrous oxidase accessory protein NosD